MTVSESRMRARILYHACLEKKAQDVVCLDVRKISPITDFFIIGSGTSSRHVHAVAENVWDALKELGTLPRQARRTLGESWVLIDARDVMVHLFAEEARKFYSLEELWHSAPKVKFR